MRCLFATALVLGAIISLPVQAADLAARARGHEVYVAVKDPEVLAAVRKLMPERDFQDWRIWAEKGVSAPMVERDGVVYGYACQPHNCGIVQSGLAIDHAGNVYASITENGQTRRYFGNPPDAVKPLLTVGTN